MADDLVRVEQTVAGQREVTRVSAEHVEEYLATHPGATVMDSDWRPAGVKVARVGDKKDEK